MPVSGYCVAVHLYLMRHGQSHVNLTDLTAAHRDDPLTDIGREQAEAAGRYVASDVRPTRIYCSTVARAAETADFVTRATGLAATPDDRLREIGTASADASPIPEAELVPYVPDMWGTLRPYEPVTPGGESWMQFRARVGSFIEFLLPAQDRRGDYEVAARTAGESVLIVCHAGVIEAVFEYVFEKGPWSVVAVMTNHTGLCHLEYHPMPFRPDWRLHGHNHLAHLDPELIT